MKNTLEKYAEGLTTRLLQIPRESIKENYVFVIEDEKRNLQLKKAAHNFLLACVSIVSFLLISTFISSIYYKGLIPFVFTLISFTLFLLIFFWLHEKSNPNKDIKKYDQLLDLVRNENSLFEKQNYSEKRLLSTIEDHIAFIKGKLEKAVNQQDFYDTKTLVLLIDILNQTGKCPNFRTTEAADLIRNITGCSKEVFRKQIFIDQYKKDSSREKRALRKKLDKIKSDFNKANFYDSDEIIENKIKEFHLE